MVNNTKYGSGALQNNSGNNNTAVGAYTSYNNLDASNNTAIGSNSAFYTTTGSNNTSLGAGSLCNNTTGALNTAIGSSALEGPLPVGSVGNQNTAVGAQALYTNQGNQNTAIGAYSALGLTGGSYNTFLGANTSATQPNFNYSTGIGYGAVVADSNQIMMGGNASGSYPNVIIPGEAFLPNFIASGLQDDQIVPKSYVDTVAGGLKPTQTCLCATTANLTYPFSGAPSSSDTDGINLSNLPDGSYNILVISQGDTTTPPSQTLNTENGVWVFRKTPGPIYSWSRPVAPAPMSIGYDAVGAFSFIQGGTIYGKSALVQTYQNPSNNLAIVGTDTLQYQTFYQLNVNAGRGLNVSISNNEAYINVDTSLNFVNFLDSNTSDPSANGTLALGTNTNNRIIIGPTGTSVPIQTQSIIQAQEGITGSVCSFNQSLLTSANIDNLLVNNNALIGEFTGTSSTNWSAVSQFSTSTIAWARLIITSQNLIYALNSNGVLYTSSTSSPNTYTTITTPVGFSDVAVSGNGLYISGINTSNSNIYVSINGGSTWTSIASQPTNPVGISMSDNGTYQTVIMGNGTNGGVYISTDSGSTWSQPVGSPTATMGGKCIAVSSSGQYQTCTASFYADGGTSGGGYVSNNYGSTWSNVTLGILAQSISMSSTGQYQTAVYTQGSKVFVSSNYGVNWSSVTGDGYYYSSAVSSTGQYQYLNNNGDSTLLQSDQYGTIFSVVNQPISVSNYQQFLLATNPNSSFLLLGYNNNSPQGKLYYRSNNGPGIIGLAVINNKVGVNISTPSYDLDVSGNIHTNANITLTGVTGGINRINFTTPSTTDAAFINWQSYSDGNSYLEIGTLDNATLPQEKILITQHQGGSQIYERMRINNRGIYINPTSSAIDPSFGSVSAGSYVLDVSGNLHVSQQISAPGGITGATGSFDYLKVGTGGDIGATGTSLDVSGNILLVNSIDNTSVNQFGYSLGVISTSAPNALGIVNSSIAVLSQGYETAFIASRGNTFNAGSNPKNFFAIYQDALNDGNYNPITKQNDHVLLTGEYGRNPGIQDASGGIVICPWSSTPSGARMDVSGNFTFYNTINAPVGITGATGSFNSLTSNNINTTGAVNIGDTLTTNNVIINGSLGVTGPTFLTNTFEVFTNSTNSYQGAFLYGPTGSAINQNEGTLFSANGRITEIKMNNQGPAHFTISNDGSFNIIDTSTSTNSYTTGQNLLCIKSNANGGNVGINTTNPSSKLDINGTLNASGNTTLSTLTTTGLSSLNSLNVGSAPAQTTIDTTGNIVANYLTLNGNSSTWTSNSAVTKAYVDVLSSGINLKAACQCATTTSISGFPNSVGTSLQIDTYNVQNNDRVLVKDQGSSVDNGIYVYNNSGSGSLSRSSDMQNTSSAINVVTFVQYGSTNARTSFLQTANPATVGANGLTFVQQNTIDFELGYGLTLSGSTISVNSNLFNTTSVGTLTSLTVSPGATSLSTLTTSGLATLNSASVTNSLTTNTATINNTLNVTGATTLSSTLTVGNNMSFSNFTGVSSRSITFSGNSDTALLNFVSAGDSGSYFQIGTTDNTLTQDEPIFFTQNNYQSPLATYARMRINNAGVYINPDMTSDPYGTGFTNVASSSYQLNVNGSGTFQGSVTTSATFNTSDYRIKENVEILNDSYSVDNLRPVTYLNKKTDKQDIGLIAHEVQEYIPILVTGEKDGEDMQTINYIGLIGILIKEVKDLKERVKALEEK